MPRLIVHSYSLSLDGFGAGPDQSLEAPMGVGAEGLGAWMHGTRYFQRTHFAPGQARGDEGDLGTDNGIAARAIRTP